MIEWLLPDCGLSKQLVHMSDVTVKNNQISPSYSEGGLRLQKDNRDQLDDGSDEQGFWLGK